jgi:hypothetical protein
MMRGTWSIPQRNSTFTGRDSELSQIYARLIAQKAGQNFHSGVAKVEITGMGGVGRFVCSIILGFLMPHRLILEISREDATLCGVLLSKLPFVLCYGCTVELARRRTHCF